MATRQLSLLLLTLCILSASAQVFVSIDCGSSSTSYQDENLIDWSGDQNYTSAGESHAVPSSNSVSHVMDSLRVFRNSRKKNCYYIDSVRQGRVLLRASFNYGNYDNRSSPPTFDLQFDGNRWATVATSSTDYVYYEVIYVMKRDSISVCLAQTREGEFPFISALEVRGLESFMYNFVDRNYPLFLMTRFAYGSNSTVRYGDDPYDRIWIPAVAGNGLINVASNAVLGEISIASDRPPPRVQQHAIAAITSNTSIQLYTQFPPTATPVYINWYFSEVAELAPNETRSLRIFVGNQSLTDPFSPPYKNCSQWTAGNYSVSGNTTISLVPSNVSTLPPLINAMEVFVIGMQLTNGTNIKDVQGLASLRRAFDVLEDWNGDPCLPAPSTWDWIQCNNDTIPRVTAMFLGSFGLSGVLPDFSSMDALQTVDLHNNSLSGPIPDFLGTLPRLTELNLSNNQFNGSVPASVSSKSGLNLVVTGNSRLCTSSNSSCPTTSQTPRSNSSCSKHNKNSILIIFILWFIMH